MKLKTVAKLSTVVSVLLFGLAVAFYALTELDMTRRNRNVNLFAWMPADCVGVLESDNINAFLNDISMSSYGRELDAFRFSGLFHFLVDGLNEYAVDNAHGLSSQMNHVAVSFHRSFTPHNQLVCFRMNAADERLLSDMLREYMPANFLPKVEEYRGKTLRIYPLGDSEFLASYAESGLMVVSYEKRLVEKAIDARLDGTSLNDDEVFAQALARKKSHNHLTLYARSASFPFLRLGQDCWSEYDFHANSEVLYLTGETFLPEDSDCLTRALGYLGECPQINEADRLVSVNRNSTKCYMEQASATDEADGRTLFDECVSNLSWESSFALVADMRRVTEAPQEFSAYLPSFMLAHARQFRSFILSAQLSLSPGRASHIWVFTYKE